MQKFITSDLHEDHENIIKYCGRPFKDKDHMNEILIQNWNAKVTDKDLVYVVGDVTKRKQKQSAFVDRLNGTKVLVYGNHDKKLRNPHRMEGFHAKVDYLETEIFDGKKNRELIVFHYPILSWSGKHRGSWHAYGHSHGMSLKLMNSLSPGSHDVGVDVNDYAPLSFLELAAIIKKTYPEWPPK